MENVFKDRLKELREERGLTLDKLSAALGGKISRAALGRWEQGLRTPNMENIKLLAKFFGVTSDYLIGLTDY